MTMPALEQLIRVWKARSMSAFSSRKPADREVSLEIRQMVHELESVLAGEQPPEEPDYVDVALPRGRR